MEPTHRRSAEKVRRWIERGRRSPSRLRSALLEVPPIERDAWIDLVLGLSELSGDDGPELPRGCTPYLPSSVEDLLRIVEHAPVRASDVFVDLGSGLGRAITFVHLLTGAGAIGLEIQPQLVVASRSLATRLRASRVTTVQGDAATHAGLIAAGTVFFLYCPFSGDRLARVLDELEAIARTKVIRVCCIDLPLPPCHWLILDASPRPGVEIHRSNHAIAGTCAKSRYLSRRR